MFLRALLVVSLLLPASAFAQIPGADPLSVTITPQYPRPYDTITISPGSTLVDLSSSQVTISVNGEVVEQGSGTRAATAQLGGPGSRTTVRVSVRDAAGTTYVEEVVIRPADVSLVLEATSTAHPFYEGARLVAPEGRVRVVAVPDFRTTPGASVSAQNLVYTWRNGERILTDQSGIGRYVLDAVAPVRYRDARISVTVTTQDRSLVGSSAVVVSAASPLVRVYRTGPLLGPVFSDSIDGTVAMDSTEESFRAVPYFFAVPPVFSWTINGAGSENDDELTVRVTESGRGTARIGIAAQGVGTTESASHDFLVEFGAERRGGIFGF